MLKFVGLRSKTTIRMQRAHLSGSMASFPLFCAWICDLQPNTSLEEARRDTEKKLNAILVRQLRLSGFWEPDDMTDCRHNLFMLMERKLREPAEFVIVCLAARTEQIPALNGTALHLLRTEPFAIVLRHSDLRSSQRFLGRLKDIENGSELVTLSNLTCAEEGNVPIRLQYSALRHEQEVAVELAPDCETALAYYARVRAVRHESFEIRMGFVVSTARYIARDLLRERRKGRELLALEDLPPGPHIGHVDYGQDIEFLSAKRAILRLPKELRTQLIQRYVQGLSWSEIASLRQVTEVKVRKDDSRVLTKLSEVIVAAKSGATPGAVSRVVKWLKELLPAILERG